MAALLLTVAEEEQEIERQRQALANNASFETYAAFTRLDRKNMGYICGKELQDFLAENGYDHLLEAECNYIVRYFDSNPEAHNFS
jgi:Ca2+-binding EF-hand superfamily protein